MKYNLTDIWENTGKVAEYDADFSFEELEVLGEKYKILNPSKVKLSISNEERGKAYIKARFSFETEIPCSRCLKPVMTGIEVSPEFMAISPELQEEILDDEIPDFMEKYLFDADKFILSELLLEWPSKILCKDDCAGICHVCGSNLNEGECGCNRIVPNPAFAALSDLIKFD